MTQFHNLICIPIEQGLKKRWMNKVAQEEMKRYCFVGG